MSAPTTHEARTARPNASRIRFVLILGGLAAFGPLSVDMYLPAFPAIADELGGAESQIQLTLTACILGLALGQLVLGPLSDTLGRRRPLLVGLLIYALLSVACAIAPSAQLLAVARFLQGVGGAAGIVISRAAVRDLYSGVELARFFSMLMLVNGLAPILAPVFGSQLLVLTSWRGIFFALSAFGALLLVVAALALPETLPPTRRATGSLRGTMRAYRGLLADRMFVGYLLTGGLFFAALFTYISAGSFVMQGIYGLSPGEFSAVFAANSIGLVLLGQLNGRLVGRFATRRLLGIGLSAALLGSAGLVAATVAGLGLPAILPPLFVTVASIGMIMPNSTALALADYPNAAGSASALLGVGQFVFGGLAAPLTGLVSAASAVPMAVIMAALTVGATLVFRFVARAGAASSNAASSNAG